MTLSTWRSNVIGGPVEEGDLVKVWKDEDLIQARARMWRPGELAVRNMSLESLLRNGWNVTVLEKAKPPIPTKSGFYVAKTGETFLLDGHGDWWHLVAPPNAPTPASPALFRVLGPLTRLVPEKS